MLTATILYNAITRDYSNSLSSTAKEPVVARNTKYFLANIGKITSASQLVNNSQLYQLCPDRLRPCRTWPMPRP